MIVDQVQRKPPTKMGFKEGKPTLVTEADVDDCNEAHARLAGASLRRLRSKSCIGHF